jgi:hypothetical protein
LFYCAWPTFICLVNNGRGGGRKLGLGLGPGRDSVSRRDSLRNLLRLIVCSGYRMFNKSLQDPAIRIRTFLQRTVLMYFIISLDEQIRYDPTLVLQRV